jgi:hypothetical protein
LAVDRVRHRGKRVSIADCFYGAATGFTTCAREQE